MGVEAEISRVGGPLQATDLLTGGQRPSSVHETAVIYGHLLPPGPGARTKELKRRTVSSALAVVGVFYCPRPVCTCKSRNRSMSTTLIPTVTTRDFPLGDLRTERGDWLNAARLRYRIIGDVDAAREHGWILVFHALTGSADVPDWWGPLVGPGRALDTTRHAILSTNLLGGCYGSTSPIPWQASHGRAFPRLSSFDLAQAHVPLLAHLGVRRLALATGGSLGGMVTLQWGRVSPVPVDRLVVFAAPAATSAQAIAWNAAQRMAIEADPAWREGAYPEGQGPTAGLAAARAIAMITYRSAAEFADRFARSSTRTPGRFDADQYLRSQGDKLVARSMPPATSPSWTRWTCTTSAIWRRRRAKRQRAWPGGGRRGGLSASVLPRGSARAGRRVSSGWGQRALRRDRLPERPRRVSHRVGSGRGRSSPLTHRSHAGPLSFGAHPPGVSPWLKTRPPIPPPCRVRRRADPRCPIPTRMHVRDVLSRSFAEDRLSMDELDHRLDLAEHATSVVELQRLIADLAGDGLEDGGPAAPDPEVPERDFVFAIMSGAKTAGLLAAFPVTSRSSPAWAAWTSI